MKQINFFAVALAALTMFSCSKENTDTPDTTERVMTVKIANPASTKAIEAPGVSTDGTIQLENGVIFTLNGEAVVGAYALDVTAAATATGQLIGDKVTSSTKVFVVANVPATKVTDWTTTATPATLTAIKALALSIAEENGSDYTKATLCNTGATVATPTANGADAVLATVEISPVYSRLELPEVVGEGTITSFTVKGVYVDDFYPSYTIEGSYTGALNSMEQTPPTAWPTEAMNEGSWASDANNVAIPSAGNVWAYNLPSGNLPRLIIKLDNVFVNNASLTGTWYLSVRAYTGNLTVFAPGDIYHITDGIVFDQTDLGPTPNPIENDLSVAVAIKQWTIKGVGVTL